MRRRRFRAGAAVLLAAGMLVACSGSGGGSSSSPAVPTSRPSSPAKLRILSPSNGQTVHGSTVNVRIELSGARIVRAVTKDITPTKGHLHVFLDDSLVSMNYGLSDQVHVKKPGTHVLRVEFVASDHLPFDPRVVANSAFQVKP
jgi:hypothetical protein